VPVRCSTAAIAIEPRSSLRQRRHYASLIRANTRHRLLLRFWLVLYVFIGIQMGWVLRPFVGDPNRPTQFFREGAWSNAYVEVAGLAWGVVAGR